PHSTVSSTLSLHDALPICIVPTSASVSNRWATPPANWLKKDVEELTVEYNLPKLPGNRKYYGYVTWVYYKEQLQAAAASPETLRSEEHTSELQSLRHLVCR